MAEYVRYSSNFMQLQIATLIEITRMQSTRVVDVVETFSSSRCPTLGVQFWARTALSLWIDQ